jgi:predicted enzyme related to lactoylglutathione lyase
VRRRLMEEANMPERQSHEPGTPSWVDIGTDIPAAKEFYGALFGWSAMDAGPVEETGGYGMFLKGDKMVAGFGPQMNPGPPVWTTYVAVTDADDTASKVQAASGTVVMAPMDVMTAGRMAVFQDPQGAFFSIWQAGEHTGAQLVDEPGAFCWTELSALDVEGSKAFYSSVFGWTSVTHEDGPMPYTEFQLGGTSIAGMMPQPPGMEGVPPHWLVYFAVEDTDATVARCQELGGSVMMAPMDIPQGRFAVLADSKGAAFGVIRLAG